MKGRLDPAASGLTEHTWYVSFMTVGELAKGVVRFQRRAGAA